MAKIFFHADDFGVSLEQSKRILDCYENGALNSLSIIPNSKETSTSYDLIRNYVSSGKIRLVIHLNFVEGHSMSDSKLIPDLVDENGFFRCSYGRILKLNYGKSRDKVKEEFKREISAQIESIIKLTGSTIINVDSHQHYLQIPMIFEALIDVIAENNYTLNYLRIPVDPISPIWSTPSLFFKVPLINHIKWALLKFLKQKDSNLSALSCNIPIFFGMPFTCQMTYDKISILLPKYLKIADKQNRDLELMFHPGAEYNKEKLLDSRQEDLVDFYSSNYRSLEYDCLMKLSNR